MTIKTWVHTLYLHYKLLYSTYETSQVNHKLSIYLKQKNIKKQNNP